MKSGFRSMEISLLATGLAISMTTGTAFAKDPEPRGSDRTTASTGDFIELVVPLDEKQNYSLQAFCRECNRKLNTSYALDAVSDRRIHMSIQEQRLLRLLAQSGLGGEDSQVVLHADRLVLRLPNPETGAARQELRHRIASLFGVSLAPWLPGKGLHLPDDFAPERRSMLLIHGLESSVNELQGMKDACRRVGVQPLLFDYPNDGPAATSGRRLHEELDQLAKQFPQLRLVLVAHSMGGLVARYALETCRPALSCVTDVFFLGTPHQGASLSSVEPWLELVFESLPNVTDQWKSVRDGLGEAADDLRPGSLFLRTLDARQRPQGVRYHTAIGRRGFLSEQQLLDFRRRLDEHLKHRGASELQRARLTGFLRQADALCTGKGDGAVEIRSARLPGADSTRTFELSHAELIRVPSDRPEESPVFQWMIQTLRWNRS